MPTVFDSLSSDKANPVWSEQVKLGRGRNDTGAFHRALAVARTLFQSDIWDGRGLLIVHDAYETHRRLALSWETLAEGQDYEFAGDSTYSRDADCADINPANITALRSKPLPGAWERRSTYAVDTADGRTVEVSLAEWRALLQKVRHLTDRRMLHRHLGVDMFCNGILLEVIQ